MTEPPSNVLFYRDIWNTILDDGWMWCVIWGKPRTGKTTIQLKASFDVYKDWDQVLSSVVFNLSGILYKMRNGEPCRIMTRNKLHERVPLLIGDDFGAQCNKAKTQHEPAWDIFKGAFDTLATKVAVFLASMGNPSGVTQQLQDKYTHEIYVESKGHAKYDKVDWQQNYGGWQPRQDKDWLQSFDFTTVPMDIYKQYDEMRLSLVDELFTLIDDSMIENEGMKVFKRLTRDDVEFITLIYDKGQVSNEWVHRPENQKWIEVLKRAKARSIIVPKRKGTSYWYDLTDFGYNLLNLIQAQRMKGELPSAAHMEKPLEIEPSKTS